MKGGERQRECWPVAAAGHICSHPAGVGGGARVATLLDNTSSGTRY